MSLEQVREFGSSRAEWWRNPPRGTCSTCARADVILHTTPEGTVACADCYSRASTRDRVQACDRCGNTPAFRDPAPREDEYLCPTCHEKNGYLPGERAMISQIQARAGVTHSKGRKERCEAAGHGTECRGEVKPRGKLGVLCAFHHNPKLFR